MGSFWNRIWCMVAGHDMARTDEPPTMEVERVTGKGDKPKFNIITVTCRVVCHRCLHRDWIRNVEVRRGQ